MTDTMESRVVKGIEWLDEVVPGWRDRIDLDTLNLSSYHDCVIAQVTNGDFVEGWEQLNGGLGSDFRERQAGMGFDVSVSEYCEDGERYYAELSNAWLEALSV